MKDEPGRLGVILVDVLNSDGEAFDVYFLERNGHDVIVCHGPSLVRPCPLLRDEACPKFAAAHGVVFELDLDRVEHREIVEHYRTLGNEALRIRVVVRCDQAVRYADLLAQVQVWSHEPNAADLDASLPRSKQPTASPNHDNPPQPRS